MSNILCLYKYQNYMYDLQNGTLTDVPSFNSNQNRLHTIPSIGDRAYVVTYYQNRCYLVGRITIAKKELNSPNYKYGLYKIIGDPKESAWFAYGTIEITKSIFKLEFEGGKKIPEDSEYPVAIYLQTFRELTDEDTKLLESFVPKQSTPVRTPKWVRDELILALELFFRVNPLHTNEKNPEMVKLSELLNHLPIHSKLDKGEDFRNPNSVYMKLCNFLRFDPGYHGKYLDAGLKLDQEVWNEFYPDRQKLIDTALAIRRNYLYVSPPQSQSDEEELEYEEFQEGRILSKIHRLRERNTALVNEKKAQVLDYTGKLSCEACGFDFKEFYGDIGYGFAECHHNIPLSEINGQHSIKISEVSIVCPNCHSIMHKVRPWLTISSLKNLLFRRGKISLT